MDFRIKKCEKSMKNAKKCLFIGKKGFLFKKIFAILVLEVIRYEKT